jgi:putative tricarboxylic transport membrane protein
MHNAMVKAACAGALAATLGLTATVVHAQGWKPERPMEIIIGTSAGGALDRTGRLLLRVMQELKLTSQPATVINKPGGSGVVGLTHLAQHAGDAHYTMITGQSLLTNHVMGRSKLNYTDFTPLAILVSEYISLSVRADAPIKSAKELIERLRKDPTAFSVAVGTGVGSATHASFAHAMHTAGVDVRKLRQVTFGSGGESMTALLGGHVDAISSPVSSIVEQLRTGRIRIIAVSAPRRLTGELAEVPTWTELGVNSAVDVWRGLAGPKNLSAAQIEFWDGVTSRAVKDREWTKELARSFADSAYKGSAETFRHWQSEYAEMRTLYTALGLVKQ